MYIFTDVPSDVRCELLNNIDVAGQFVLSWKTHLKIVLIRIMEGHQSYEIYNLMNC